MPSIEIVSSIEDVIAKAEKWDSKRLNDGSNGGTSLRMVWFMTTVLHLFPWERLTEKWGFCLAISIRCFGVDQVRYRIDDDKHIDWIAVNGGIIEIATDNQRLPLSRTQLTWSVIISTIAERANTPRERSRRSPRQAFDWPRATG